MISLDLAKLAKSKEEKTKKAKAKSDLELVVFGCMA
jgi:hypothetical protein